MTEISSNRTIAKNTLLLYVRMVFTMLVSLYTSRVILSVLGVVDDGIYNLVGGIVGMFMFLKGSLSGATSRFLTFELGRGDKEKLKQTFAAALLVHIFLALILVVLIETIGLWWLNNKAVIPAERMHAARFVFHFSAFSVLFSVTQVPYSASVISHEKMGVFAYMSILEVVLKLVICYALLISPFDKLITYSFLVLAVSISLQMIYRVYCIKHFEECHLIKVTDGSIIMPILSFSWWDLFGNFSSMARNQGKDIIMNMFFGPTINSAAGKAGTIGSAVNSLANNFLSAIKPPIVKAYAAGDIKKMESLMINASKFAFVLLMLLATPFIFESKFVLGIWLKNPPYYSDVFCSVGLGADVIGAMFLPLMYAIHASGRIRRMSILNSIVWITIVPLTYFFLKAGGAPVTPYVIYYFLLMFGVYVNMSCTKRNIPEFNVQEYLKKAIAPSIVTALIVLAVTFCVYRLFDSSGWLRFLTVCFTSTITLGVCAYFIVCDNTLRSSVNNEIKRAFRRLF